VADLGRCRQWSIDDVAARSRSGAASRAMT
jgi:hypothetical protein